MFLHRGKCKGWYGIFQTDIQASIESGVSGGGRCVLANKQVEVSVVWYPGSLSTRKTQSKHSEGVGDEDGLRNTCGNLEKAVENPSLASCCNHQRSLRQQTDEPGSVSPPSCGKPRRPKALCTDQQLEFSLR